MKLLIKLSYLGENFCGYQVQSEGRSVQGELTRAAAELFGARCDITGCSRTDSGVHANCFCATVSERESGKLDTSLPLERIPRALNAHLPDDISVFSAEWVDDGFHPRYDVRYKEYIYRIYVGQNRDPFERGRSLFLGRDIDADSLDRMNLAASQMVGKHDFTSFMACGSNVCSTVREVIYADVTRERNIVTFRVAADGFLYNMVRIMTGTLLSVAQGKTDPYAISEIIEAKDRNRAGMTAPPEGLYLNKVEY